MSDEVRFRIKLMQAGTEQIVDGGLTHAEAERRLDIEESVARAAGWKVDFRPGQLVLTKDGTERLIQLELHEQPEG